MLGEAGAPLGTGRRACPLATRCRLAVRGYPKELPQRLDGELFVREVLEAAR